MANHPSFQIPTFDEEERLERSAMSLSNTPTFGGLDEEEFLELSAQQAPGASGIQRARTPVQGAPGGQQVLDIAAAGRAQPGTEAQKRALQLALDAARGRGPSAALSTFQQGLGAAQRAAMAQAASGTAADRSALRRTALLNFGLAGNQQAAQAAGIRAREMQGALGLLGGLSTQTRGQDLGAIGMDADRAFREFQERNRVALQRADLMRRFGLDQAGFRQQQIGLSRDDLNRRNLANTRLRAIGGQVAGGLIGGPAGAGIGGQLAGGAPPFNQRDAVLPPQF